MKPKQIQVLAAVTVASLAVAAITLRTRDESGAPAEEGRVFPGLAERINEVAELELEKDGKTAALKRVEGQWRLANHGGYPAKFEKVKEISRRVADLEIEERKTARKENHAKLGVQWPPDAAEESEAKAGRVTLKDAGGTVLASLVVGRTDWQGSKPKVFVRRAEEDQVYLCAPLGALDVLPEPKNWIDPEIVELANDRVQSVTIEHADGERVEIARSAANHTQFAILNMPPGQNERYAGIGNSVAQALGSGLQLEDVRPAAEVDFAAAPLARTRYRCTDGLELVLESARFEEEVWVRVSAAFTPPPEPAEPAPDAAPAEGEPAEGAPEAAADGPAEAQEGAEKDVGKEAEELNQRLAPWAFAVSSYRSDVLARRMKDLLAEPDAAATGDGGLDSLLEGMGEDGHEHEEAVEPEEELDDDGAADAAPGAESDPPEPE
jgi:hypothetical protein